MHHCKEFEEVLSLLKSTDAYKHLRPGFFSRYKLHPNLDKHSFVSVKYLNKTADFSLHTLFENELHTDNYYPYCVPYKFEISGKIAKYETRITSVEIQSYKKINSDDGEAERSTIKFSNSAGVKLEDFISELESQLNHDYHQLNEVEKTYFKLQGKEVVGDMLIYEFKELIAALESISYRGLKRSRRFRIAEFAIGQWIDPVALGDTDSVVKKIGAALFNGAATYHLTQLYFGIIELCVWAAL